MQISSSEILQLIAITSVIFLIAPVFLIVYVISYHKRKMRDMHEKAELKEAFDHELLKIQFEVREQTLKTVAYDLHDNIGQLLSLTAVTLSAVNLNDTKNTSEKIEIVADLTKRSIAEVRLLSKTLQADELLNHNLAEAVKYDCDFLSKNSPFKISYKFDFTVSGKNAAKDIVIFRLFQETINNVIKHASASAVLVSMIFNGEIIKLEITDNGCGFDVEDKLLQANGLGLDSMKKRIAMIGGNVKFTSKRNDGTTITFAIPYP